MRFYTYFHTRNDTDSVFYIGKGQRKRAYKTSCRSTLWKRIVAKHGYSVHIASWWETEKEAFEHEILLIACFRDLGINICNMTDGGDGISGYIQSPESRAKQGMAIRGNDYAKGNVLGPETRAKMSQISKNRRWSPETKAKMSASAKARWEANPSTGLSQEHKDRIGKGVRSYRENRYGLKQVDAQSQPPC